MELTFVEMYKNIYKKFGKDSKELKRYKDCFLIYQDKKHILVKIYKNIMKGGDKHD